MPVKWTKPKAAGDKPKADKPKAAKPPKADKPKGEKPPKGNKGGKTETSDKGETEAK